MADTENEQTLTLTSEVTKINAPHQWIWEMSITYINEQGQYETKKFGYPLTLQFNIVRNTLAQSNTGDFTIYNLAKATRSAIFQDRFATQTIKYITLSAGYEGNLVQVFRGKIQECYSKRVGVDVLTNIKAWDIGVNERVMCVTFQAGTTFKEAIKNVLAQAPYDLGAIGDIQGTFKTDTSFVGTPLNIANQITNGHTFVDNGTVNTLNNNECLDTGVLVLNDKTLIGTPERRNQSVTANIIFNPNLMVGQLIEVQSSIASEFSGTYYLGGMTHSGTISGAEAGQRITTVDLLSGAFLPNSDTNITGQTQRIGFTKVKQEKVTPVNTNYGSSVEEVYRYIKDHKGNVSGLTKRITSLISWKDMLQPAGSGNKNADINAQITKDILYNCENIAQQLTNFMNTYCKGYKIKIVSGWRTIQNNASLSNASKESVHLKGGAIDFTITNAPSYTVFYNYFYPNWQYFTYLFRVSSSSRYNIHVQNTLGKGGARRSKGN